MEKEQRRVTRLHHLLDALRDREADRLKRTLSQATGGHQALLERDVTANRLRERITRLDAAENGLCFGRLDLEDGERRYVGRLGILDEEADHEPVLIDWRAPAARPFYTATGISPQGVRRRRHIRTSGRTVTGVQDELLAPDAAADTEGLTGEAALLAALDADRTGRMSDIVETIQAEQDRIIRAPRAGVLVVQGGPGTGKTAVALHRAAYLLYTHRERLERSVVLLVGPNPLFLRYVGEVLPSLGETSVLPTTVADLYPGVVADGAEPAGTAEIKGRAIMAEVVAAAVRDRQRAPDDGLEIVHGRETVRIGPDVCRRARDRARAGGLPHNRARPVFVGLVIDALARRIAEQVTASVLDGVPVEAIDGPEAEPLVLFEEDDIEGIRRELREDPEVCAAIDELWPPLTPRRLLTDLYASPERLASAAPDLTPAERALLLRAPGSPWTPADVPLLDEAAELLGEDDRAAREAAEAEHRDRVALAQEALDVSYGSRSTDAESEEEAEILAAHDLLDARRLAERHEETDHRTPAERAAADRTWAFGHVVVDEAQELSAMDWRLLMRRCPNRSMTLVGDIAQTGSPAGASSWREVLAPYVGDRWRLERLEVNYRTPAEIAEIAAEVSAASGAPCDPPRAVRSTGTRPWRTRVAPDDLPVALAALVVEEAAEVGEGRLAVIVPSARLEELGRAVAAAVPGTGVGRDARLEASVVVLDAARAKGLEFDSVVVVEPERVVAGAPRGANDLYVALTRATRRLGVLHTGEPPAALARLGPRGTDAGAGR
ncbi:HelD family protein [Streptomyces megasporus]|uniref:HelD family protein n=1 Tax=Streptomyces megasporus TaxID=44060 RepID=UPI001B8023C9|nr:ATP-binding domain-containing protein [Streptomyces megasporus]